MRAYCHSLVSCGQIISHGSAAADEDVAATVITWLVTSLMDGAPGEMGRQHSATDSSSNVSDSPSMGNETCAPQPYTVPQNAAVAVPIHPFTIPRQPHRQAGNRSLVVTGRLPACEADMLSGAVLRPSAFCAHRDSEMIDVIVELFTYVTLTEGALEGLRPRPKTKHKQKVGRRRLAQ